MKYKEIKKMSETEWLKNLEKLKKDLFNLRFQKKNGQLKNPSKFKETRKNIARINTLMRGKNA